MRQLDLLDGLQRVIAQGARVERYVLSTFREVKRLIELLDAERANERGMRRVESAPGTGEAATEGSTSAGSDA